MPPRRPLSNRPLSWWSAAAVITTVLAVSSCRDMVTDAPLRPSGEPAAVLAGSTSIDYPDFNSLAGLNLEGSAAAVAPAGGVLHLTSAAKSQTGAAWFARPQPVSGGFSTTFSFRMRGAHGGDGIAFVIQNNSAHAYFPPAKSCGSCLGYTGMPNSVAVEFDTYRDADVAGGPGVSDNQVAIHSNGVAANSYETRSLRGAASPALDLNDGASHTARIDYQPGSPGTLSVFLKNPATGAFDPVLSVPFDLASIGLSGGSAWVGFTAATGEAVQSQDVQSWSFATSGSADPGSGFPFSVLVTNPAPVPGMLVTATDIRTGEARYQATGPDGKAHFDLLDGSYIFTARHVATTDPQQLQVWPYSAGTMPVSDSRLAAFAGSVYVGGTSRVLTPANYNAAFRSPLVLNAPEFAHLGGQIELKLTPTATIGCTMLDSGGDPAEGMNTQLFGTLPYSDTTDLPPIPPSFTGNRNLPRGLGYGVTNMSDGDSCEMPGAPAGTTILETPPVLTEDGLVVYRAAVTVSDSAAAAGAEVEMVAGPQPMLAFTNYFTGEPWGDARGWDDIGGLITYGWKTATDNTFVVTSGFRGLGIYTLDLFTSDPGAHPERVRPAVEVSVVCAAKRCRMLPVAPKPPRGTTATGVGVFHRGESQGSLLWQVPLPGNPNTVWLSITTPGGFIQGDRTVVLKAVRQPGNGNSYLVLAGS